MSVRSLIKRGFQQLFVIVFIHVDSRRLFVAPSTANPDAAWVAKQAEAFLAQLPAEQRKKFYLQHDGDSKFSSAFDERRSSLVTPGAVASLIQLRKSADRFLAQNARCIIVRESTECGC